MKRRSSNRVPILVSYAYLRFYPEALIQRLCRHPAVDVLMDSGGFSALNSGSEIALADYISFIKQWGSGLWRYIALDKLQDPVTSTRNLEQMIDDGLKPVPVHVFGEGKARLNKLFSLSDFVAMGGLRRPHRGHAPKSYVKLKMEWAAGRPVHWLGYTNMRMLMTFKPFSCDSANWTAAQRYGVAEVYRPGHGLVSYARIDVAGNPIPYEVKPALQACGYSSKDWYRDESWRSRRNTDAGFMSMEITAYSWVKFVLDFHRSTGVSIFIACANADPSQLETILRNVERVCQQKAASS